MIHELGHNQYLVSGEVSVLDKNTVEITELPVRTWTQVGPGCRAQVCSGCVTGVLQVCVVSWLQAYKESVLEPMLLGTDKTPALISDYKEYHTDTTVKFVVRMSEEKLAQAEAVGLHKVFKLQSSLTCNSMVPLLRIRTHCSFMHGVFYSLHVFISRCCLITWVV